MAPVRIIDVTDEPAFALIPPCADARFDHRTCDYWEDADRGSKAHRPSWLNAARPAPPRRPAVADNPFAPAAPAFEENPFLPGGETTPAGPRTRAGALAGAFTDEDPFAPPAENPFVPARRMERPVTEGVPRKLALLDRGRGVFGSYAKVLLADGEPAAYCQFGPLSAYPRAARQRELYPQLPASPLPAAITCIASTAEARRRGLALALVEDVCRDLADRGFAAVEAYPDRLTAEDETSAAKPEFWERARFTVVIDDERFPVVRRELG